MSIDREMPLEKQIEIVKGEVKRTLEELISFLQKNVDLKEEDHEWLELPEGEGDFTVECQNLNLTNEELTKAGYDGDYRNSFKCIKIEPRSKKSSADSYYIGIKSELGKDAEKGLACAFLRADGESNVVANLPFPEHKKSGDMDEIDKSLLRAVPDSLSVLQKLLEGFIKEYKKQK